MHVAHYRRGLSQGQTISSVSHAAINHAEQRAGSWSRVLCSHVIATGSKAVFVPPANTFDSSSMLLVALDSRDGSSSI